MTKENLIQLILEKLAENEKTGNCIYIMGNDKCKSEMRMYACSCLFHNPFTKKHELTIAARQTLNSFLNRVTNLDNITIE